MDRRGPKDGTSSGASPGPADGPTKDAFPVEQERCGGNTNTESGEEEATPKRPVHSIGGELLQKSDESRDESERKEAGAPEPNGMSVTGSSLGTDQGLAEAAMPPQCDDGAGNGVRAGGESKEENQTAPSGGSPVAPANASTSVPLQTQKEPDDYSLKVNSARDGPSCDAIPQRDEGSKSSESNKEVIVNPKVQVVNREGENGHSRQHDQSDIVASDTRKRIFQPLHSRSDEASPNKGKTSDFVSHETNHVAAPTQLSQCNSSIIVQRPAPQALNVQTENPPSNHRFMPRRSGGDEDMEKISVTEERKKRENPSQPKQINFEVSGRGNESSLAQSHGRPDKNPLDEEKAAEPTPSHAASQETNHGDTAAPLQHACNNSDGNVVIDEDTSKVLSAHNQLNQEREELSTKEKCSNLFSQEAKDGKGNEIGGADGSDRQKTSPAPAVAASNGVIESAPDSQAAAASDGGGHNDDPSSRTSSMRLQNSADDNREGHSDTHDVAGGETAEAARPPLVLQQEGQSALGTEDPSTAKGLDGADVTGIAIDLTGDDSPLDKKLSPHHSPLAIADPLLSFNDAMKSNGKDTNKANSVTSRPAAPSPPASPLPFPKIHGPPPLRRPRPKPHTSIRTLLFQADGPSRIASGSLCGRSSCGVSYDAGFHLDGSGSCLDDALRIDVNERLKSWDPFLKIVEELGTRKVQSSEGGLLMTDAGTRTTPCQPMQEVGPCVRDQPCSCTSVTIDLPKEASRSKMANIYSSKKSKPLSNIAWGVMWGSLAHPYTDESGKKRDRLQTGDRRLIVRTMPLQRDYKDIKKRADGHLWPKGTFLQLMRGGSERVLFIKQRVQQKHDRKEWKGISHPLDITTEVSNTNMPIELRLCSKEKISANPATENVAAKGTLAGSYALHVAICEYVAPDDLYDQLLGKTIPTISFRSARKIAKEYFANQTVSIIDSDDEDGNAESDGGKNDEGKSLTFSLICPISKTVMSTPVRGRQCKHLQCFDLKNFLHANSNLTGGRWRCGACEAFVCVRDLIHCGLFQAMIDDVGSRVSGSRDRVSFCSDGTWKLMDENRLRYSNKRGGSKGAVQSRASAAKTGGNERPPLELEVIDLD